MFSGKKERVWTMAPRGRPPSSKTLVDRQLGRNVKHPILPAGDGYIVPNHSGDHSAGHTDNPIEERDLANKAYVDNIATRNEIDLFLTENASDIGGYFDLEVDVVTAAKENIVQSITGNSTTLIASFASILDEEEINTIALLESGIYALHIHAEGQVANNLAVYCEFYKRTAGGVETLLGTTHDSNLLTTSEAQYEIHASITEDTAWVSGDRFVIKVYGRNNLAAARNITIYMEGDTASRAEFPGFISLGNYLLKAGGTISGDLTVEGEMKGSRMSIEGGNSSTNSPGQILFMKIGSTLMDTSPNNIGIVMRRAGSIVGVSLLVRVTTLEAGSTAKACVYKGTALVLESATISGASTGVKTAQTTQARGVDTFVAGNIISFCVSNTGEESYQATDHIIAVEVQYDT